MKSTASFVLLCLSAACSAQMRNPKDRRGLCRVEDPKDPEIPQGGYCQYEWIEIDGSEMSERNYCGTVDSLDSLVCILSLMVSVLAPMDEVVIEQKMMTINYRLVRSNSHGERGEDVHQTPKGDQRAKGRRRPTNTSFSASSITPCGAMTLGGHNRRRVPLRCAILSGPCGVFGSQKRRVDGMLEIAMRQTHGAVHSTSTGQPDSARQRGSTAEAEERGLRKEDETSREAGFSRPRRGGPKPRQSHHRDDQTARAQRTSKSQRLPTKGQGGKDQPVSLAPSLAPVFILPFPVRAAGCTAQLPPHGRTGGGKQGPPMPLGLVHGFTSTDSSIPSSP
ncbi:predicted protein [Plenodomus lingam JN3]|uniref:Predicted protein n=1 Tax=Leptosphaeria maculans (strain JN3 / isolate v23.1.3 / race Av1-4-5-6-7-8) TaxID=985895 RepID=E5AE95_LEPMJ|nr:predicted protein [Plenodomus lingam JN3]CBY01534.1 predicted protein [Plenodomus lingam JN3]